MSGYELIKSMLINNKIMKNEKILYTSLTLLVASTLGLLFYVSNINSEDYRSINDSQSSIFKTQTAVAPQVEPESNYKIISPEAEDLRSIAELRWKKYTNTKYGFEIEYPANWYIQESETPGWPSIVFYKEATTTRIHFQQNLTQVAIYPQGYPSENMVVETATSSRVINSSSNQYDFVLSNNKIPFASFAQFSNKINENWTEFGFVSSIIKVSDLKFSCVNKTLNNCDTLEGDKLIAEGTIYDNDSVDIEKRILSSFKFIRINID